jgi:hypothetical protein
VDATSAMLLAIAPSTTWKLSRPAGFKFENAAVKSPADADPALASRELNFHKFKPRSWPGLFLLLEATSGSRQVARLRWTKFCTVLSLRDRLFFL